MIRIGLIVLIALIGSSIILILSNFSAFVPVPSTFPPKETNFLKSLSEAKRALGENSIYVNKNKVQNNFVVSDKNLINNKFILLQRGKKNYFLVNVK